jgi:mono/diheme cytochrome c family protein
MFLTNLKIVLVVALTLAAYTLVANMIPQIESEVPEELSLSGEVTPQQLVAAGERVYNGAGGCTACHGLGTRAPNLLTSEGDAGPIGNRCADRQPGMDCKEYIHTSLVDPSAYVVEGYAPIMPEVSRTLSNNQIWALVAFLQSQGGEVTVTAEDIGAAGAKAPSAAASAGADGAGTAPATDDPRQLMDELGCLACHQIAGEGNAVGPSFDDVGARHDAAFIRESILNPAAQASPGYENLTSLMPPNFGERMSAAQLEALVRFLAEHKGG